MGLGKKLSFVSFLVVMGVLQAEPFASKFECKEQGSNRYRPYYLQAVDNGTSLKDWSKTSKGLLGQNAMKSLDECQRAVGAANTEFGVVCSRTGLDGWKPTIYTGTTPGRPDFGYMGGSSIMDFADCLKATQHSSKKGVCFWGGSDWYVSPIDKEGMAGGPYNTVEECVRHTGL